MSSHATDSRRDKALICKIFLAVALLGQVTKQGARKVWVAGELMPPAWQRR
jgi:hypothetical protein